MKKIRLGVKYCGACNPQYDRTQLIKDILKKYDKQVEVFYNSKDGPFDLVLVMNACEVACASHESLSAINGKHILFSKEDSSPQSKIYEIINELIKNRKF